MKEGDRVVGVETSRGTIRAPKVGVAVAGMTSEVLRKAGIEKLPIESHVLQAFVTEPLKPLIHCVVTFGAGHMYVSQSDKGGLVYGGNLDYYNSYAQRGNLPVVHEVATELLACFPNVGKVRLVRSWGGLVDMTMDGSPIITTGPLPGMYLNSGWNYGGFKATPASGWCFAWTIANDAPARAQRAASRSSASTRAARSTNGAPARRRGCTNDADPLPDLRPARPERVHLWRRRDHRPAGALRRRCRALGRLRLRPHQPARAAQRILAPRAWLPLVDDRRAQHRDA